MPDIMVVFACVSQCVWRTPQVGLTVRQHFRSNQGNVCTSVSNPPRGLVQGLQNGPLYVQLPHNENMGIKPRPLARNAWVRSHVIC